MEAESFKEKLNLVLLNECCSVPFLFDANKGMEIFCEFGKVNLELAFLLISNFSSVATLTPESLL